MKIINLRFSLIELYIYIKTKNRCQNTVVET